MVVAGHAERLGGRVQIEPVPGLVLHLRQQDGLALERGRPGDPVPLGLHSDDLGVSVLGDLTDQRTAVGVRHPVTWFDLLVCGENARELLRPALAAAVDVALGGSDQGMFGVRHLVEKAVGRAEVVAVHARHCYTVGADRAILCNITVSRHPSGRGVSGKQPRWTR